MRELHSLPKRLRRKVGRFIRTGRVIRPISAPRFYVTTQLYAELMYPRAMRGLSWFIESRSPTASEFYGRISMKQW